MSAGADKSKATGAFTRVFPKVRLIFARSRILIFMIKKSQIYDDRPYDGLVFLL
jgi:hypothetical protein